MSIALTFMPDIEIKTMVWIRQIRDANAMLLQGKTHQERLAYYREKSALMDTKIRLLLQTRQVSTPQMS